MLTARRRRSTLAIAASVAAHLGVLIAVLLQHHTLVLPVERAGPPEPIIPMLILPRTPPAAAGPGAKPAPIQLHRRPQRDLPTDTPVAPLVVPAPKAAEPQPQAPAPAAPREPAPPAAPPEAVRNVLRTTLGCADARLSRDERAGCQERLGRGARDAPYFAPPLSAEKRAGLEQAGAAKLAARAAAERGGPAPTTMVEPSSYDGDPDIAHNAIAAPAYPPSKRAARVLGRLPP
jgi:hypothetical protein